MAFLDETGLTHLWGKITGKFLAKANVANNLTTTSEGYALDARQGVALMNAISSGGSGMKLSGNLVYESCEGEGSTPVIKSITLEKNAFCSFYLYGDRDTYVSINGNKFIEGGSDENAIALSSFAILTKGTLIKLTADYNPSGIVNVVIQYFE